MGSEMKETMTADEASRALSQGSTGKQTPGTNQAGTGNSASNASQKRLKDSRQGAGEAEDLLNPGVKQALRVLTGPDFRLGKPGDTVVIY